LAGLSLVGKKKGAIAAADHAIAITPSAPSEFVLTPGARELSLSATARRRNATSA